MFRLAQVPSFHSVTTDDVDKSRDLYNKQPPGSSQPQVGENCLQDLNDLFVKRGVEHLLGIHLAHGHGQIPDKCMLLGENSGKPLCRRARITRTQNVDLSQVHGHVFIVDKDDLHPYEYQQGHLSEEIASIDPAFFSEFIRYIRTNNLSSLVCLEILNPDFKEHMMSEIVYQGEALMWESARLKRHCANRTTGWIFSTRGFMGSSAHAADDDGHHPIVPTSKPGSVSNLKEIEKELIAEGILTASRLEV